MISSNKKDKLPNLLLLGAQKSASTFFSAWLSMHPDVYITSKENTSFEDPEYDHFKIADLKLNISNKVYGIRRPDYFGNIKYQTRVAEHLPDAKIIIILRNPVSRAISAYYHYMKYGIIPIKPPKFIKQIIKGHYDKSIKAYSNILTYGNYFTLYTNLLKLYDAKNILMIKQEELLKEDFGEEYKRVCRFLSISEVVPDKPRFTPQASIYDYKRLWVRRVKIVVKNYYDKNRTKAYTRHSADFKFHQKIWFGFFSRLENLYQKHFSTKDQIDISIRKELQDYYHDEMISLNKLGIIDCSNWFKKL